MPALLPATVARDSHISGRHATDVIRRNPPHRRPTLTSDLDRPLQGRTRKDASGKRRRNTWRIGAAASAATVAVLASGALWGGVTNWTGFDGPTPAATVEPAPAVPDTATTTGTVAEAKPTETPAADPGRPNELSRTMTGGGSAIIQVRPSERPGDVEVRDPAQIGQAAAMAHLPLPELLETVNGKRLPRRSDDGLRPFDAYARPWSGRTGPRVALVVGGLGLSQTGTQSAIAKLASPVTLAFASEGNSLGR